MGARPGSAPGAPGSAALSPLWLIRAPVDGRRHVTRSSTSCSAAPFVPVAIPLTFPRPLVVAGRPIEAIRRSDLRLTCCLPF